MTEYQELNGFLHCKGVSATGGQIKNIIRSGAVLVNGVVETRNKRKLVKGDEVMMGDKVWKV
jgi:ribosome-associated protein